MTQLAPDGTSLVTPQLIVPAYFHPAVLPHEWEMLIERAANVRLILLNLDSGPGTEPDAAFAPTLDRLHSAGVAVAGYVDTNYTQRPTPEVLDDIGRYIDWYGVSGVFFDRVSATAEDLDHYADLTRRAREMGVRCRGLQPRRPPGRGLCRAWRSAGHVRGHLALLRRHGRAALDEVMAGRAVLPPRVLSASPVLWRCVPAGHPAPRRLRVRHRPRRGQPLGSPPGRRV